MLSKPVGPTGLFALNATTGTTTLSRFDGTTPRKVRVAVTGYAAVIQLANNGVADNNSDILIPPGTVEHFSLEGVTTCTYVIVSGAGGTGLISFTPVA
jgi:hypothetical protein